MRGSLAALVAVGATIVLMPQFENSAQAGIETGPLRESFDLAGNYLSDPEQMKIDHSNFISMLADPFLPVPGESSVAVFPAKDAYKDLMDVPLTHLVHDL